MFFNESDNKRLVALANFSAIPIFSIKLKWLKIVSCGMELIHLGVLISNLWIIYELFNAMIITIQVWLIFLSSTISKWKWNGEIFEIVSRPLDTEFSSLDRNISVLVSVLVWVLVSFVCLLVLRGSIHWTCHKWVINATFVFTRLHLEHSSTALECLNISSVFFFAVFVACSLVSDLSPSPARMA